ncbi:ACT domain-containing protein [Clostridium sp. MCC353]|uniref:ACT domain-containing protein n=1 Tax=Clostridium sp. MCC353 TaxID=2592646 RepID=UPI001C0131AC|nr:ACT domain-containing protein [Clostridium sp. MCC353]MBT9775054.1 ACT domain-containing protein [Clostridium sp. MCC353]
MEIRILEQDFSVCKLEDLTQVDFSDEFCFIGKTDEELSLVCSTKRVPSNTVEREDGWRAFRIQGTLDFSLIGILSRISALLAGCGIGIFAVSTYNADYILTKAEQFEAGVKALEEDGYEIIR